MLKLHMTAALVMSGALTLLPAAESKTANDVAKTPAPPRASAAPDQTKKDLKADMVQMIGGRFQMGDKDQVDAPPHEVLVSSFYMDKHLVTQEQYQKVMGSNPSRWKGD